MNRPVRPEIWTELVDGKALVCVYVPEAQPGDKPVFIQNRGLPRGAYRRIGSTDQRCNEDDLLVFAQNRQHQSYDQTLVPDARLEDLDPDAMALYRKERERAYSAAEELGWPDEELLQALGAVEIVDGIAVPTVAGVLLFGTKIALRRLFPMMRIDYIRVPGTVWVSDPEHRFDTVEIRDPLMRAALRAQAAILDDLPKAFSLPEGQIHRQDQPLIPDRVIREAVVNAIMHRNYRVHGPIQIIRYSNRLEIRNPGYSLKAEDRLGEPGSHTRNPRVAGVLHDLRLAETKGSGIRVMRQMMNRASLDPPAFESDRERDSFTATFFFHHFLSETDLEWLGRFKDLNLTSEEARALVIVREAGRITNAVYRDLNDVDTLTASLHLRRLRDAGLLRQHDHGAATFYTPIGRMLADAAQLALGMDAASPVFTGAFEEESGKLDAKPVKLEGKPGKLGSQPGKLGSQPGKLGPQSGKLDPGILEPDLPDELVDAVAAAKRRAPQPEMRDLVVRLCAWRPLSAEEISGILDRARSYVTDAYITPLVREGRLTPTVKHPTDPRQKYRAAADPQD
jgi:ATP-dependent DNA helicase RecG